MKILLLILFFFDACTSLHSVGGKKINYDVFPEEKELTSLTIELDTAIFRYPFRIRICGNKAVVMDLHNTDYYYHMFTYPEFTYLSSFGKKGEAPSEMLSADNIRFSNQHEAWTLDANKTQLVRLGFSLSGSGDSLLSREVVSLDNDILRALDFSIYNDSTFIIPDYSGKNRFCWVNRHGHLINRIGSIPTFNKDALKYSAPALAQAWRSFIDYNPCKDVLAVVTQLGEVLEIYNLKDTTHTVCVGPHGEPEFRQSKGYAVPTGIMGFSDIQVTDHYIYTVFHGRTFKELGRQKGHVIDGGRYIYVFSLKGEPVCKYNLDRYIYGIYVDESRGVIIATDVNSDQPLVEFRMAHSEI
ncbi:BF3164 family lipoprotein [uncultured Bacteroides sp.]|uniref:BF3164 family lipoprotein n=1 Tax=uncultured Bacteroides sp. TaxID=162156 RepID=UPI002AAC2CB6|nr:BF3164 family lipoprotein [uncultured Bacteroides sp.]